MQTRYVAKSITIHITRKSFENHTFRDLWNDINIGRIPMPHDEFGKIYNDVWLVVCIDNYSEDRQEYDYTVTRVTKDFIDELNKRAEAGELKKYHYVGGASIEECCNLAWEQVSNEGRTYVMDYEVIEPNDGKPYSDIWVSVEKEKSV